MKGPAEFDPAKDRANRAKHGLSLEAAVLVLDGDCIETVDDRRDYGETRVRAIGEIPGGDGRLFVVVYTRRAGVRRIISFRKANDREVRKHRSRHP